MESAHDRLRLAAAKQPPGTMNMRNLTSALPTHRPNCVVRVDCVGLDRVVRKVARSVVSLPVLFLFLSVLLAGGRALGAASANVRQTSAASAGSRLSFAVADFDGDNRPDFVTVQPGRPDSSQPGYWIQLRLSEYGKSLIRVAAPKGGLFVEARDVNGDHAVDLVFATAWRGEPIAVLLNDGHGNFSRSDPSAYPNAFSEPKAGWDAAGVPTSDTPGVPQESFAGHVRPAASVEHIQQETDPLSFPHAEFLPDSFLIRRDGRAPPPPAILS